MLILPASHPDNFHCPGCGKAHSRRLVSEKSALTEEHIIAQALGNERWSIALCGPCNSGFNQRFETTYLNMNGVIRARASLPLRTRRPGPTRWTNVTRVRSTAQDLLSSRK
jgi:hypothetical protein